MSKYEVSTLKKGLQILDLLQVEQFLTLTEITWTLDINKTTALDESERTIDWTLLQTPYQLGVSAVEGAYIGVLEGIGYDDS